MIESAEKLPTHYQQLVEAGVTGIDIMHGMLKIDMLEAEARYTEAVKIEEENDYSDAMESMDRKYEEGFLDALTMMYKYTYDISFAIADREARA
jgi:uncharacterized protein involved in tellurium resistance